MSVPPTGAPSDAERDDEEARRIALNPRTSAWLSASAGSGKTRVLVDRILALLLTGTKPERLLCLTYTRAAAAEMRARLADSLMRWATLPELELEVELEAVLAGDPPAQKELDTARRLFFVALDAPGGIRIQTIHSFCQELLRRFPIEAGIPPGFHLLEENTKARLRAQALVRGLEAKGEPHAVVDRIRRAHDAFSRYADDKKQTASLESLQEKFYFPPTLTQQALAEIFNRQIQERLDWRELAELAFDTVWEDFCAALPKDEAEEVLQIFIDYGGKTEAKNARAALLWLKLAPEDKPQAVFAYQNLFLTQTGSPRARFPSKGMETALADEGIPPPLDFVARETERLQAARVSAQRKQILRASLALLLLSQRIEADYSARKKNQFRLDYQDLIRSTCKLLETSAQAAWVLWKLDEGLDHILIDEAQDTNPQQWEIVNALTSEFFAGAGAYEERSQGEPRTLFAVGDLKQSIYSFQGADLPALKQFIDDTEKGALEADHNWSRPVISRSYRSSEAVLKLVDSVFATPELQDGLTFDNQPWPRHFAHRKGQAGCVEWWPLVPREAVEPHRGEEGGDNDESDSDASDPDAPYLLATHLADRIEALVCPKEKPKPGDQSWLDSHDRPLRAGDILLLRRNRSGTLFSELEKQLKQRGIPVAARDRVVLANQPVVADLVALGQTLLNPDNNLALATSLKSPAFDFSDNDLLTLARQGKKSWFHALKQNADPRFRKAAETLQEFAKKVDFVRPYALYSEILHVPRESTSFRAQLLYNHGHQADEDIEQFLSFALACETHEEAPTLLRLLHALERDLTEHKSESETGRDEVRILTIHGAKGLQAPVVILPQTLMQKPKLPPLIAFEKNDKLFPFWRPSSSNELPGELQALDEAAAQRDARETRRLLYVALTRAQDRLYIYGITPRSRTLGWHDFIYDGMERAGAERVETINVPWSQERVLRLETLQTSAPDRATATRAKTAAVLDDEAPVPSWLTQARTRRDEARWRIVGASSLASDGGVASAPEDEASLFLPRQDPADARARGKRIHTLLEFLTTAPVAERRKRALLWLRLREPALDAAAHEDILRSVFAVLEAPDLATLFAADGFAEVDVFGTLPPREEGEDTVFVRGRIDRLVIEPERVLIIDYKSDKNPPSTPERVSQSYLGQLAAYRRLLQPRFAPREVSAALLWTETASLMHLPNSLLDKLELVQPHQADDVVPQA